jgi:two-component system LytT family response regulator
MTQPELFLVNTMDGRKCINLSEILFMEAKGKRTEVIFYNSSTMITNHTLGWFQDSLPKNYFIRIHRSYIVNKTHVKAFTADKVTMDYKRIIPVGRCYRRVFELTLQLVD